MMFNDTTLKFKKPILGANNCATFDELLLILLIAILPFCLPINHLLFHDYTLFGVSIMSVFVAVVLAICSLTAVMQGQNVLNPFLMTLIFLIFITLLKFLLQGSDGFLGWLLGHQYYFLVLLFAFCVSREQLNCSLVVKVVVNTAVMVSVISLYSFFTSNYFGMVSQEIMTAYDAAGLPFYRLMSLFGSPNVAGSYFAIVLVLDCLHFRSKGFFVFLRRALFASCVVLSFSRMSILGCLIALVILYFRNSEQSLHKTRLLRSIVILVVLALIAYIGICAVNHGVYFFDLSGSDFQDNPRISKWLAFAQSGMVDSFFGEPFNFDYMYLGYTLSDNSFLLSISSFGLYPAIAFWGLFLYAATSNSSMKECVPQIIMLVVFMIFSDFIELFPSSYFMILLFTCKRGSAGLTCELDQTIKCSRKGV